jgi:hypothetical protein
VRASVAAASLLVWAAAARAQTRLSLAPELSLAAGYDDNLFLDPALTGATGTTPRADAVFDIRPSLQARVAASGHLLTLDVDYGERVTTANGDLRDLWLRLGWSTPRWHRLRLSLAPSYEHYAAARFPDNTFDLAGGDASLRLVLTRAWFDAGYRILARLYSDVSRNHQLDVEHTALATAHVRLHRLLTADAAYRFVHLASNAPTAALDRHRAEVLLVVRPTSWLTASAGYAFWAQSLPRGAPPLNPTTPGGARSDLAHAVSASLSAHPLRWLDLFARYDLVVSTSDAVNGRYQRNQVIAGAVIGWSFSRESPPRPATLMPTVRGRVVTFRARARPGAAVGVVGDWNGWQPAPLAPVGGDLFEGSYELPSGRHAFALSIDGVVSVPREAPAFVDDGFGGKNAAVDVP